MVSHLTREDASQVQIFRFHCQREDGDHPEDNIPRDMATHESKNSAMRAVLETYELLERIIRYLPFEGLTHALQVCRTWRMLVLDTKMLRQQFFLEPMYYRLHKPVHARVFLNGKVGTNGNIAHPLFTSAMKYKPEKLGYYLHEYRQPDIKRMLSWYTSPLGDLFSNMLLV